MSAVSLERRCTARLVPSPTKLPTSSVSEVSMLASVFGEVEYPAGHEEEYPGLGKLNVYTGTIVVRERDAGRGGAVEPYVGGGVALINWRYTESGEFVDFGAGNVIFRDQYVADGSETGPIVVGGIRFAPIDNPDNELQDYDVADFAIKQAVDLSPETSKWLLEFLSSKYGFKP